MYNVRWPILAGIKCAKRFISVEPMLEKVQLQSMLVPDWVIAGRENGRGARPFNPVWLENLHSDCRINNVKFWDKSDNFICRERPRP
jgi:protein gp37